ncbi:hypothetical protein [Kangiella sp.]|uniref:hypothetical protein n=1 Tax=Kangiella sp. TaxID=1920245 RepID=UPI003A92B08A
MNKKILMFLMLAAITASFILFIYEDEKSGKKLAVPSKEVDLEVSPKIEKEQSEVEKPSHHEPKMANNKKETNEGNQGKAHDSMAVNENNGMHLDDQAGYEEATVKYDGDYRNDLLIRFTEDDFEQFFAEKKLQVNQVQCKDAVCDIEFYSTVPLYNDEDLRNDLILDIAIKLGAEGLLSEQNKISDPESNFENISFRIRMDEDS